MGYWDTLHKKKQQYTPPDKIFCKLCGKEIKPGSLPQLRYGVGIICKECSNKKWAKRET